ncbi:MAG TPA: hypothetical protein VLU25_12280 [Acidobacteriota bacterium]|nr:hypothetical protein [Acidobacteriota bacterium]
MFESHSAIAKILVLLLAGSLTLFAALLLPTFAQDDCRPDDADNCSGVSTGRCVDGRPNCVVACLWEVHNAIKLSSRAEGVAFDINGDGMTEMLPWPQEDSDDALLAMDRNLNGRIDDGTELFGNFSPQARSNADRNGFEALKPFDGGGLGGNGDGFISREDWVFPRLLLWTDRNRDGVSQSDELRPLDHTRIVSIDLSYRISKRIDGHGNQFKYISGVMMDSDSPGPRRKWAVDVVFSLQ